MTRSSAIRRPLLAPFARYRWDSARGQHQIAYPESVLVLNETSAAIVKLCDGRTVDEIVAQLESDCVQEGLADEVIEFLQSLAERGLLRDGE